MGAEDVRVDLGDEQDDINNSHKKVGVCTFQQGLNVGHHLLVNTGLHDAGITFMLR